MSDPETIVDETEAGDETEEKTGRGRKSKYPDEIAAAAQKVYRKVYNRQFKANKTILKAGKDIELDAKVAALAAKNDYLREQGFEIDPAE